MPKQYIVKSIFINSRTQRRSDFWAEQRRRRVTASYFYRACKIKSEQAGANLAEVIKKGEIRKTEWLPRSMWYGIHYEGNKNILKKQK